MKVYRGEKRKTESTGGRRFFSSIRGRILTVLFVVLIPSVVTLSAVNFLTMQKIQQYQINHLPHYQSPLSQTPLNIAYVSTDFLCHEQFLQLLQ